MVASEPEQTDALLSLICQILVLSDLSYELFELFVTELNFWIETNFCKKQLNNSYSALYGLSARPVSEA